MYRNDEEDVFLRNTKKKDPDAYLYRIVALAVCVVLLGTLALLIGSVMKKKSAEQKAEIAIRVLDTAPAVTAEPGEYAFSVSAAAVPVDRTQAPEMPEEAPDTEIIEVAPIKRNVPEYEEDDEPEESTTATVRPARTARTVKTRKPEKTAEPTVTTGSGKKKSGSSGEEETVAARSILAQDDEREPAEDTASQNKTPKPTRTPKPTATPKSGKTPRPTATPKSTRTPKPTKTPKPTGTPAATPTPTPFYKMLSRHDSSSRVTKLQEQLMELGYLDIDEPTDYFGSATENAVRLFQRQHGLSTDGRAAHEMQALLYSGNAEKYCLKTGVEGGDVKMLQQQLCELGYLKDSDIDSVYSDTTIKAVRDFQTRNGLTADGLAGEKTLDILYSDDAKISYSLQKKQKEAEASASAAAAKKKKTATPRPSPTPKKETRIDKFLAAARSKLGCEYILGDRGPKTFDCSGFVYWCLRQAGVSVTRLNAAGFSGKSSWKKITKIENLEPGDILFYRSDSSSHVNHCGIYIGGGNMIDASSAHGKVVKRPMSAYWKRNFVCARRPW